MSTVLRVYGLNLLDVVNSRVIGAPLAQLPEADYCARIVFEDGEEQLLEARHLDDLARKCSDVLYEKVNGDTVSIEFDTADETLLDGLLEMFHHRDGYPRRLTFAEQDEFKKFFKKAALAVAP